LGCSGAKAIGTSSTGITATVPVDVSNFTYSNRQGKISVCLYNSIGNKLIQVNSRLLMLNANESIFISENFPLNVSQGSTYKVRVFLWDSNQSPLSKSIEKTIHISDNALISKLQVDGVDVNGFTASTVEYNVYTKGTIVPTVTAVAQDVYAIVNVIQTTSANGDAIVKVIAQDGTLKTYTIHFVPSTILIESEHPYSSNLDKTYSYTLNGNYTSIQVTFSSLTEVENNYDFIYIMDGLGSIIGSRYTGTALAGKIIMIPGNTVKIRLTSDDSITKYGFEITNVVGN